MAVVEVSADELRRLVKEGRPVFVDFWAEWCPPCRAMEPVVEKLSKKYGDSVVFAKLNVDRYPKAAREYEIDSVPTFIIFHRGQVVSRVEGAVPTSLLEREIRKVLGSL